MNRAKMIRRMMERDRPWDMVIIGGGATGAGIAGDAATRGYQVLLVEQSDFGKGTSSRSTKLAHGGVRYLKQGNVSLVMEALRERGRMRHNAPHLVHDLKFIVPNYTWWEAPWYGVGLKVYDMLAGKYGFGASHLLSASKTLDAIPTLKTDGLLGGVLYYDGQFDDARLLINLMQTAADHGATVVNYYRVESLLTAGDDLIGGVAVRDQLTGQHLEAKAQVVINATGAFCDDVRRMDEPEAAAMIAPSQGVHLVLPRHFLPGDAAIMVPRTSDGRVMFAIPWHGCALVGTTDTPIESAELEPRAREEEIAFLLETASDYLATGPTREDVLSVFAGIRPLVRAGEGKNTAALSRDHTIHISGRGLVTVAGGKWTTYRKMAQDCVDHAAELAQLPTRACVTEDLHIHGYPTQTDALNDLATYGSDATAVAELDPTPVGPDLPLSGGQVLWAARQEMAMTVDDVLARRSRCLLTNARAAISAAPAVAEVLHAQTGVDPQLETFVALANAYLP